MMDRVDVEAPDHAADAVLPHRLAAHPELGGLVPTSVVELGQPGVNRLGALLVERDDLVDVLGMRLVLPVDDTRLEQRHERRFLHREHVCQLAGAARLGIGSIVQLGSGHSLQDAHERRHLRLAAHDAELDSVHGVSWSRWLPTRSDLRVNYQMPQRRTSLVYLLLEAVQTYWRVTRDRIESRPGGGHVGEFD